MNALVTIEAAPTAGPHGEGGAGRRRYDSRLLLAYR